MLFKVILFCAILFLVIFARVYFVKHLPAFTFTDTATYELPAMEKLNKLEPSMPVRMPVYPALISAVYAFSGKQDRQVVTITQHLLGIIQFLLFSYIAKCIFNNYFLALLPALFISVYYGYLFYEHCILSDSLAIFLFTTNAALLFRYEKRKTVLTLLGTGIVFSLLILTRPVYIFLGLGNMLAICLICKKDWLKRILLFILPVIIFAGGYNYYTHKKYSFTGEHTAIRGVTMCAFLETLPEVQQLKTKYTSNFPAWYYELLLNIPAEKIDQKTKIQYSLSAKRAERFYGVKKILDGNFNILDILRNAGSDLRKSNQELVKICIGAVRAHPLEYLKLIPPNIKSYFLSDAQAEIKDLAGAGFSLQILNKLYNNRIYQAIYNPFLHVWLFLAGIAALIINCLKKEPSARYSGILLLLFFAYLTPIVIDVIPVYRYFLAVIWIEYLLGFYMLFSLLKFIAIIPQSLKRKNPERYE